MGINKISNTKELLGVASCAILLLASCASKPVAKSNSNRPASGFELNKPNFQLNNAAIESSDIVQKRDDSIDQKAISLDHNMDDTPQDLFDSNLEKEGVKLEIPIEINERVKDWIGYFTEQDRERTQRFFDRGEAIRPHIEKILKENDVPAELFYLAMIESGFATSAKSRAKAVGVWQFMKGTARGYNLTVSKSVDERKNWIKATEAAASYLKDLHNVFGSWYLALAAYNAGEGRIMRSIMRGKTRDFWALAETGFLPKETLNYVPKFIAAHIVGRNKEKYGFKAHIDPNDIWDEYETVSVPTGVHLTDLARTTGTPINELRDWNRDLIAGITPGSRIGRVEIYVPATYAKKFEEAKSEIATLKKVHVDMSDSDSRLARQSTEKDYSVYIVRRGENLNSISGKLGTSVRTLVKVNGLRRSRIHAGQRLKYYSSRPKRSNYSISDTSKIKPRSLASLKKVKQKNKRSVRL